MAITPSTNLYILKNPLEMDNKNQLTFTDKQAQYNYFTSTDSQYVDTFTYQRQNSTIRFPIHIDEILEYNYCMYQNENYTDKWFYAYITNMRYLNDNCTEITIETDAFQTWQFDIEYKQCFVEREHVNDDTLGLHTVPEGLETGEYIINSHLLDSYNNQYSAVMASTVDTDTLEDLYYGIYNGIPTGFQYFAFSDITSSDVNSLRYTIERLQNNAKIDAIQDLFIAPKWLCGQSIPITQSMNPAEKTLGISRISSLNGYTPKNNKMLTFPYCYILATNGTGNSAKFNQELWQLNSNNEMEFKMVGTLTPGCSIKGYPLNYNGDSNNTDAGITLGKFPVLNWSSDSFVNWITQQGVNIASKLGTGIGNTVSGIATENPSTTSSGLLSIVDSVGEIYQHNLVPPQFEGNMNCGDVNVSMGANRFHIYRMTVKQEYAKIIDSFFSMFGYKVNQVKLPNITGRRNWNYVKTIDCNLHGYFPQEDVQTLKNMFNNGVTLWHNAQNFLDYSQNNDII